MKIERTPLIMKNLIRFQTIMKEEEWDQGFELLRNLEFAKGVYQNGPTFFSMKVRENEPKYKEFEFFMPVNVPLKGNKNKKIDFLEELIIPDAIMMRQADNEENFSIAQSKLKEEALKYGFKVEDKAYCICTEIYNELIIDLYLPLKEEDK